MKKPEAPLFPGYNGKRRNNSFRRTELNDKYVFSENRSSKPTLEQEKRLRNLVSLGYSFNSIAIRAGKAKCIIYQWFKTGATPKTIHAIMLTVSEIEIEIANQHREGPKNEPIPV